MKKGIFGTWFKELATLIFTQTIQAFLLAIVMTIIISALSATGSGSGTGAYAAGLLAIIALSQFGKIELLVKNIFGVTSQFSNDAGSMRSGAGGLLMAGMALRSAKKLGDNIPKVASGVKSWHQNRLQVKNLTAQRNALESGQLADAAMDAFEETGGEFIDNAGKGAALAAGARATGGVGGGIGSSGSGGLGVSQSDIQNLITAIKDQTSTLKSQKLEGTKTDNKAKLEELDAKIKQAKAGGREGIRQAFSGVTETIGAGIGAVSGGIVGLGMGDSASEIIQKSMVGAGVGDTIGKAPIGAERAIHEGVYQAHKDNKEVREKTQKLDDKDIRNINVAKSYDTMNTTLQRASNMDMYKNASPEKRKQIVEKVRNDAKTKASNMDMYKNPNNKLKGEDKVRKEALKNIKNKYDASNM